MDYLDLESSAMDITKQANSLLKEYCLELDQKYNKNVIPQNPRGDTYEVCELYPDLVHWQKFTSHSGAMMLQAASAGEVQRHWVDRETFLKRIVIDYVQMAQIFSCYQSVKDYFDPFMETYYLALKKEKGFGCDEISTGKHYLTIHSWDSKYIRHYDSEPKIEIRVISDCVRTNMVK